MSFDDLVRELNGSCLAACGGQEYAFSRVVSPPRPDDPATVKGIIDAGVELEGVAPGEGSMWAKFWGAEDLVTLKLRKGDEIITPAAVYKIVDIREDGGHGVWMILRKDREAA